MFNDEWYDHPGILFLGLLIIVAIVVCIPYFYTAKKTSSIECRLYNEKYGTNYTQDDFFWSGETIKKFLEGGPQTTQNINIKGSIPVSLIK